LAKSLTVRDDGYSQASALRFFIGTHVTTVGGAVRYLKWGNDERVAQYLHTLLRNDPHKAVEAITYFRGPGAGVLNKTGYQGNVLDLTSRLITITHDALPTIVDHIARHDTDFPDLPETLRRTWQNAAATARQATGAPPPPATTTAATRRRMRWWRT
jgi:hypothetical protein